MSLVIMQFCAGNAPHFGEDIVNPEAKQNDPYWALYREFVEKLRQPQAR
jgi:hypothetical protein